MNWIWNGFYRLQAGSYNQTRSHLGTAVFGGTASAPSITVGPILIGPRGGGPSIYDA
jgi:hypothetical protein